MSRKYSSRDDQRRDRSPSGTRRSRSRSPYNESRHARLKDRSYERKRSRERYSSRSGRDHTGSYRPDNDPYVRRRSVSPVGRHSVSPQGYKNANRSSELKDESVSSKHMKSDIKALNNLKEDDIDNETSQMEAMLGFSGFKSTHQQKIEGNDVGSVYKVKPTKYRQYMNRRGGFNRPLDTDNPKR
ncbi:hypothetical protein T552_01791 [Pneumocystis carinii B80]|uniref:U4/U6.U5 small nuclear ribonucleoprotein 27kDa protein domain-containing protein n=1 Tax=Pneumocystis carinii (strain B80) TaxID=1408658 RepID=A0A0W4ZJI9_PNEC8|nr:hypothetical protein T552_01791 [Pneumocystis carinii B80]KTW28531.1 hypothetical protein T552_01791 [Pneumocystis carinii B80]